MTDEVIYACVAGVVIFCLCVKPRKRVISCLLHCTEKNEDASITERLESINAKAFLSCYNHLFLVFCVGIIQVNYMSLEHKLVLICPSPCYQGIRRPLCRCIFNSALTSLLVFLLINRSLQGSPSSLRKELMKVLISHYVVLRTQCMWINTKVLYTTTDLQ